MKRLLPRHDESVTRRLSRMRGITKQFWREISRTGIVCLDQMPPSTRHRCDSLGRGSEVLRSTGCHAVATFADGHAVLVFGWYRYLAVTTRVAICSPVCRRLELWVDARS